ncbi:PACE efflux transporter [Azohydromonas aeria]|uniref:PACE efflux transporter n=1 Tax=Azohydromonas aeria TaxID=2590212 RepID=UPI0012FC41EB|nr:PACE efflux transporter [Azohydromonas aeria]
MQGVWRRVVYVGLYEAIAIVLAGAGFMLMSDAGALHAGGLSALCSAVAVAWNVVFNHAFERWESRQAVRGRSVRRRVAHAIGFEGGLAAILVPVIAWWLDVSLWQSLAMDLSLLLFFLVYTFVFNWAFDRVFGLPRSAQPA